MRRLGFASFSHSQDAIYHTRTSLSFLNKCRRVYRCKIYLKQGGKVVGQDMTDVSPTDGFLLLAATILESLPSLGSGEWVSGGCGVGVGRSMCHVGWNGLLNRMEDESRIGG